MKILVTGTSKGIGRAIAIYFLYKGDIVIGIDKLPSTIDHSLYTHYTKSIGDRYLPILTDIDILINNAGVQNSKDDIQINLKDTIRFTEFYLKRNKLKSILFNASSSAHTGFEFSEYSASKAGLLGYMKNVAWRVAKDGTTCNSISLGGVFTDINKPVYEKKYWNKIMKVTPLKKWMKSMEVAEWAYFITAINESMSGQDVLVDNGEKDLNCSFVYPGFKEDK